MPSRPSGSDLRAAAVDTAVAVALAVLAASTPLDPPGPAFAGPAWVAWVAGAAVGLPLAVRRRWPVAVLAWVAGAAAVATAVGAVGLGAISMTYAPVALALYTVASASGRVAAGAALVGALVAPSVTIPWLYDRARIGAADTSASEVPLWWQVELGVVTVMVTAAWAVGWTVRWRRAVRAEAAQRLAQDAVAAERLRIARELHDIVGHSMSLIAVKATVANHIADERPAETRAALVTIERTSRAALTEIRRLLGVLRPDTDPGPGPAAEFVPAPGSADLPDLADRLRSTGLRIDLRLDGADDLPEAVDLTVFRIVQEALTNVVKHADAGHCRVVVGAAGGSVRIDVLDDGHAQRTSGRRPAGQGLIGMRERVAMYGGTLDAGPRPGGGFQVVAEIPYAAAEQTA
ncbi:sensor histidine kinase [Pseudonocardia humida]|uniref:histidine kinase n=1 Tax=Pseudonocardia humida TaxID=2800819 RepID=A0ABT0ZVR9_9PSEU|nr:sensor histidine kinase [Pseudonocardia humida]MCO1654831.1 sensor histidine kinase [Pseudonocardia humida]